MTFPALFADRLLNIAITGSLVRIELGQFEAPQKKGDQPRLVPGQVLVMPLEGFTASFNMLEAVMKKMLDDGVVKRQDASQAPDTKQ
jgi:hypothetical protein